LAFTAASKAAREKKLDANIPKKRINTATKSRGRKRKNLEISSPRAITPSALIPKRTKPSKDHPENQSAEEFGRRRQGGFVQ